MVYFCRSLTSAEAAAGLRSFFRHQRNISGQTPRKAGGLINGVPQSGITGFCLSLATSHLSLFFQWAATLRLKMREAMKSMPNPATMAMTTEMIP